MSNTEINSLRKGLVSWIDSLDDYRLLKALDSIKLSGVSFREDWWDGLKVQERENIHLGLKDMEEGNTLSSEEFWKELHAVK